MKSNELNFTGQRIYVGMDVHKRKWQITIIVGGIIMKRFTMNPSPKELSEYLRRHYPGGEYYTVYEAGFSGFWADRQLRELGINNIVVNPGDVPTKISEKKRKTDKIDSKKLARELSVDHLDGIYVPTEKAEAFRTLVRLRKQLVVDQTRQKNRIKSLLMYLGYSVPDEEKTKHWSGRYIENLRTMKMKHEETRATLDGLLEYLNFIRAQLVKVMKQIKEFTERDVEAREIVRLLRSIPGIGITLAVSLYSEIIDIRRFKKLDDLASYVGFSPAIYSSGDKEINLGLTKQKNKYLRNNIVEAAWTAVRMDPAMQVAYGKLVKKMQGKNAIIRICKKLLNRVRYVWMNRQEYAFGVIE